MIYNITIDDNAEFAEVLVRLLVTRCSKITEKIINFSFLIETTVLTFYGTMLLHNTDNHLIRLYEKKNIYVLLLTCNMLHLHIRNARYY